jgi:hypothetical protein
MSDATYYLSNDCYVCRAQRYWIVLNAKRDRYLCIAHADLTCIGRQLHGWNYERDVVEPSLQSGRDENALLKSLESGGIITSNPVDGKAFAETDCAPRESSLEWAVPHVPRSPSAWCLARFFVACTKADWHLRLNKISRTLAAIERRRRKARTSAESHDVERAKGLIANFKHLRPLYPRPYLCLFDSLALLEFLASWRIYPHVVFGVIADPFQAHCWLQEGSMVLNDELERVARYIPVLSM